ncbi:hypothetical protein SESBI_21556 [Sesbania bispinosa]|nr:hypothetical protein SESBI_21556 [Sesbania bispinosa]
MGVLSGNDSDRRQWVSTTMKGVRWRRQWKASSDGAVVRRQVAMAVEDARQ